MAMFYFYMLVKLDLDFYDMYIHTQSYNIGFVSGSWKSSLFIVLFLPGDGHHPCEAGPVERPLGDGPKPEQPSDGPR
jgi:hypothetical protein